MGHRLSRTSVGIAAALIAVWSLAGPASAATIVVSRSSVPASGTVVISGDVLANGKPGCTVPGTVTLISGAFVGISSFAGQGAVIIPVDSTGHFSRAVIVRPTVRVGHYTIVARCGGGNLGVSAELDVTGLPKTGASFGPFSAVEVAIMCFALIALGGLLTVATRRRTLGSRASSA